MAGTFVQDGKTIDYTPGAAVVAGAVILQGTLLGVALKDIAANALGALAISGVFAINKVGAVAFTVGEAAYWDATPGEVTNVATANTPIGFFVKAAASGDTTANVALLP